MTLHSRRFITAPLRTDLNEPSEIEDVLMELLAAMEIAASVPQAKGQAYSSPECNSSTAMGQLASKLLSPRWMITPKWTVDDVKVNQSAEIPLRQSNLVGNFRGGGPAADYVPKRLVSQSPPQHLQCALGNDMGGCREAR